MRALRSAGRVLDLDVPPLVCGNAEPAMGAVRGIAVAREPGDEGGLHGPGALNQRCVI